jgi:hypothetical protein
MRVLRVIYVLGIAGLLIALVIAGVEAFYPDPEYPEYPDRPEYLGYLDPLPAYNSTEYEEWQQEYEEWQQEYEEIQEEYQQEVAAHDKNVFLIVLPLGVVFAIGGIFLQRKLDIFGTGLILGGIGTMIFAVVPYDLEAMLRFIGIAVTLAVFIFVGYKVFPSSRKSEHRL